MNLRLNHLIGMSVALNSLVGGRASETISGSLGRAAREGKWWATSFACPLVDSLFGLGHCAEAAADEQARREATSASLPTSPPPCS